MGGGQNISSTSLYYVARERMSLHASRQIPTQMQKTNRSQLHSWSSPTLPLQADVRMRDQDRAQARWGVAETRGFPSPLVMPTFTT